jgi:hypothetical protein
MMNIQLTALSESCDEKCGRCGGIMRRKLKNMDLVGHLENIHCSNFG